MVPIASVPEVLKPGWPEISVGVEVDDSPELVGCSPYPDLVSKHSRERRL